MSKSIFIVPHLETNNSGVENSSGRFSGSNPRDLIKISALILYSEFSSTSGFLLPEESAAPSFILFTCTSFIILSPINFFGAVSQINSTPSSIAFATSLDDPGIFSLSLL